MTLLAWIKKTRHQNKPYCYLCGRDCHDYIAPDVVTRLVEKKTGKATCDLCYDCFCTACKDAGLPDLWRLTSYEGSSQELCRTARGGKKWPIGLPEKKFTQESLNACEQMVKENMRKVADSFAPGEDVGGCG